MDLRWASSEERLEHVTFTLPVAVELSAWLLAPASTHLCLNSPPLTLVFVLFPQNSERTGRHYSGSTAKLQVSECSSVDGAGLAVAERVFVMRISGLSGGASIFPNLQADGCSLVNVPVLVRVS